MIGENHPQTARSYSNIGAVYEKQGNNDKALYFLESSLRIRLSLFGEEHPDIVSCFKKIGDIYNKKGNFGKAVEYHKKSLSIKL